MQLAIGTALSFVPGLSDVELPPEVVLVLFLPALLYWESLNTSLRGIRRNARVIVLSAVPLVLVTLAAVAFFAHQMGIPWPMAIVFGSVVAPTDATAVSALASALPRNTLTTLRAESLVNDGTALTVYAAAVSAAIGSGSLSVLGGALYLAYAYSAAVVLGLLVGVVVVVVRRAMRTRLEHNTLSVLTPFVAYLPAEAAHASGVVAVVTAGLFLARRAAPLIDAGTRMQGAGFWQLASSLLNGALFVLVGLQAHRVLLSAQTHGAAAVLIGIGTTVLVILVRFIWVNTVPYLIRLLDRRVSQRGRRVPFRRRQPFAAAGFRGGISLAAALAVPVSEGSGTSLEYRDIIIAAVFVVIVATLTVQGFPMPALIRWARFPEDRERGRELQLARAALAEAAIAAVSAAAKRTSVDENARIRIENRYRRVNDGARERSAGRCPLNVPTNELRFRRELVAAQRRRLHQLREIGQIDDSILVEFQDRLDIEEITLGRALSGNSDEDQG
jgi:CPA1 family monovalent cation:H+ antiporter